MKPTREQIEEAVRECIAEQETERAKGNRSGHWYYARARWDGDEIQISTGCEASPCYPESEYYGKGEFPPVTFWECKETYSPGADDGLEWVACDWSGAQYIGKIDPKYTGCFDGSDYHVAHDSLTQFEAAERLELVGDRVWIDDQEHDAEIQKLLTEAGWGPFRLGDPVEPPEIDDLVHEATNSICEVWNVE